MRGMPREPLPAAVRTLDTLRDPHLNRALTAEMAPSPPAYSKMDVGTGGWPGRSRA